MKILISSLLLATMLCAHGADSGDTLHGVTDAREDEPLVVKIPDGDYPLEYYLKHMPLLSQGVNWNDPVSFDWALVGGCHASVRQLGLVKGHQIMEVRYTRQERISKGADDATAILLLAHVELDEMGRRLLRPIFCSHAGLAYNRTAEYMPKGDGELHVSLHFGNSEVTEEVFIRGVGDVQFERFTPKNNEPSD